MHALTSTPELIAGLYCYMWNPIGFLTDVVADDFMQEVLLQCGQFLLNTKPHINHPIIRLWGQDMRSLLWIHIMIYMYFYIYLFHVLCNIILCGIVLSWKSIMYISCSLPNCGWQLVKKNYLPQDAFYLTPLVQWMVSLNISQYRCLFCL